MDTRISPDNPFGHTRHGFAWEHVPADSVYLDFGCYEGRLTDALRAKGVTRAVGVDVNGDAIARGTALHPHIELHHLRQPVPLTFAGGTFSAITLLDVLEHVDDQKALLDELHRVLSDDGILVITVPRRHIFSFLDRGNYKFRFPRVHRWYFCLTHSRKEYEYRYVNNPDGLVGDVSANKRWHEHFTESGLAEVLAGSGFEPTMFDGSGLFARVSSHVRLVFGGLPVLKQSIAAFDRLDARLFKSMNLFCIARKKR